MIANVRIEIKKWWNSICTEHVFIQYQRALSTSMHYTRLLTVVTLWSKQIRSLAAMESWLWGTLQQHWRVLSCWTPKKLTLHRDLLCWLFSIKDVVAFSLLEKEKLHTNFKTKTIIPSASPKREKSQEGCRLRWTVTACCCFLIHQSCGSRSRADWSGTSLWLFETLLGTFHVAISRSLTPWSCVVFVSLLCPLFSLLCL